MRAYVFWHYPKAAINPAAYHETLREFHEALNNANIDGLSASYSFAIQQAPWLEGQPAYEDWYLIRDSAVIDVLDTQSVSGKMTHPHGSVAAMAGGGIAGLYKPVGEAPHDLDATAGVWFHKPNTVTYPSMMKRLTDADVGIGNRLWQRMLTLGPTPEFCLLGGGPDFLPYEWKNTLIVRRPVVGGGRES